MPIQQDNHDTPYSKSIVERWLQISAWNHIKTGILHLGKARFNRIVNVGLIKASSTIFDVENR